MLKNPYEIIFTPCKWDEIHQTVAQYYKANKITVDSFWEDHVLESNHYQMTFESTIVGYFSIHNGSTIILFNVFEHYANLSQELFLRVKKYESVTNAMLATGDEFFLSHAIDQYARLEKQAYFSIYTDKKPAEKIIKPIVLRLAEINKDQEHFKLCGDFLDDQIQKIKSGSDLFEIYIAEWNRKITGFGVMEYGRVLDDMVSIGMYVCEEYRRQGIAASILYGLKQTAEAKGLKARSGCWYYNHNSKKSMESVGAYAKSRLLRFYF